MKISLKFIFAVFLLLNTTMSPLFAEEQLPPHGRTEYIPDMYKGKTVDEIEKIHEDIYLKNGFIIEKKNVMDDKFFRKKKWKEEYGKKIIEVTFIHNKGNYPKKGRILFEFVEEDGYRGEYKPVNKIRVVEITKNGGSGTIKYIHGRHKEAEAYENEFIVDEKNVDKEIEKIISQYKIDKTTIHFKR